MKELPHLDPDPISPVGLPIWRSLRFQSTAALLIVVAIILGAQAFTSYAIRQHRIDMAVKDLAIKLDLTVHQLMYQGMNYKENAPRDYETYYRDVRLYYRDLMRHVQLVDRITTAFMHDALPPDLTGLPMEVSLAFDQGAHDSIVRIEETWDDYRAGLMEKLGDDPKEPRLEWAAEFVIDNHEQLEQASREMVDTVHAAVERHLAGIELVNGAVSVSIAGIVLLLIAWTYIRVLRPLNHAVAGFQRVARGDFGFQVPVRGASELALMTRAFNDLTSRLYSLFRLIDTLQTGSDLEETLRFVKQHFSGILPLDWIGALLLEADGQTLELICSYSDDPRPTHVRGRYVMTGAPLREAMASGEPIHVPDIGHAEDLELPEQLLEDLASSGIGSAIFLPVTGQDTINALLIFAATAPRAYSEEHLELLHNVAHLVTHSFGKTVRLSEQTRLAAIGEFASGIAHEVRNPLATISLALEYFQGLDLPERATKRADLAAREIRRVERLLEDILLYSKPLRLQTEPEDLVALTRRFLGSQEEIARSGGQRFTLDHPPTPVMIQADENRLTQVMLNLAINACEAAPEGESIDWRIKQDEKRGNAHLLVRNGGKTLSQEEIQHLFQPFYTTKPDGTGLGLPIVKRIVEAHGGSLSIYSSESTGTEIGIRLPLATASR